MPIKIITGEKEKKKWNSYWFIRLIIHCDSTLNQPSPMFTIYVEVFSYRGADHNSNYLKK